MSKRPKKSASPERETLPKGEALRKRGAKWIERVEAAAKLEKHWLDDAKKAVEAYTGEGVSQSSSALTSTAGQYDFNILFANVETIVPAVINSAPVPDIRRRFADPDPIARVVSEILERAIRIQVDDSRLQVEMEAGAQDSFLAGRGVVRIRYHSDIIGGEPTDEEIEDAAEDAEHERTGPSAGRTYLQSDGGGVGENVEVEGLGAQDGADPSHPGDPKNSARGIGDNGGPAIEPESLANERIAFEAVSWIDYRHGPAKRWEDRPWDAFRFCIPREDEDKSFDKSLITSQMSENDFTQRHLSGDDLTGWEIWDKDSRQVIFVDDNGVIVKEISDPLGLSGFFCISTPMQPIEVNGRLMPVNPFSVYRRLADDLDDAVRRKNRLIKAMKAKGWYGTSEADMAAVLDLDDNEFAPIKDPELWATNGGIEKAIAFWPLERFIVAIQQLDAAINIYKQWIYEITGISDIVRGASNSAETATAQNIKSQWGSLRIQKMQRMMERCARDLFIMMSEIIPAKFSMKTLEEMTGIPILPKPDDDPAKLAEKAAVQQLLKRKLSTYYRIDVESDSTVRADLTRQKQEVSQFLQGAGAYFQAVGPLVQQGALPADAAVEIFAANARMFNLGRSVEDTLEQMVTLAKQKAQQGQGQPQQPDPKAQAEAAKTASDAQRQAAETAKMTQDTQQKQAQFEAEMNRKAVEFNAKVAEDTRKAQADGVKAQQQVVIDEMERQMKAIELDIKRIDLEIKQTQLATARTPTPEPAMEMTI